MKGPQIKRLTKRRLIELYVNDPDASMAGVAQILGCNKETVRKWLIAWDIPRKARTRSGRVKKGHDSRLADAEWMRNKLTIKTQKDLANELGCSNVVVSYWAHKHGIMDKDKSQAIRNGLAIKYPDGRTGERASNWQGGRRIQDGYVYLYFPDHPNANGNYVQEHRLVMEEQLGRYLEPNEIVHHLNGVRDDNRPENLVVKDRGQHASEHFKASHEVLELRQRVAELEAELAECKNMMLD